MDDAFELSGDEKYSSVMNWLISLFGDDPVPSFPKSNAFINDLYQLSINDHKMSLKDQSYKQFLSLCQAHFSQDAELNFTVIKELGLLPVANSVETNNLASIANAMSLNTVDESNFILAMTQITLEKENTASAIDFLRKKYFEDSNDLCNTKKLNDQLSSMSLNLEKSSNLHQNSLAALLKDVEFYQNKLQKYRADGKKLETQASKSGMTSSLTHSKLTTDYEELVRKREALKAVEEQLKMFAGLTPDRDMALVKLEVAKGQLQELEDQLAKQIDFIHL